MDTDLGKFDEVETGEAFTIQGPRLVKVELSETSVMAKSGAMVAYQGDVHFEHKGGGLGRLLKKAATGESLRLMTCEGTGEVFLANQAMLVHVIKLNDDSMTVNGQNILAFETGIDWDITKVKGGTAGMLAGGLFNVHLKGTGTVALVSDGEPVKLERRRGGDLRRPPGRDRLVLGRRVEPEDRRSGQVADRHGLGRELPARDVGRGMGAGAALRGPAGNRRPLAPAVPGAQLRERIDRATARPDLEVQVAAGTAGVARVADHTEVLAGLDPLPGAETRRVREVRVPVVAVALGAVDDRRGCRRGRGRRTSA